MIAGEPEKQPDPEDPEGQLLPGSFCYGSKKPRLV